MTGDDLHRLALGLLRDLNALTPGRTFTGPVSLTLDQAYELQSIVSRLREQRGEKVIGYKVGCTSRTIQEQLGVDGPIFGRIFDTGWFRSAARISHGCFANLAVEAELAVRLGQDLSGTVVSEQECREAIEAIFPVIELHHYVVPKTWAAGPWLIASNGIHAGFVGAAAELPCGGASFAHSLSIRIDDIQVGAVADSLSLLRWPIDSLRWLAGRLARLGVRLRKGQVILTGSPLELYPAAPGSRIVVEAPPLGTICVEVGP
jgi:2-keto-4-pentenoate hydratase